MIEEFIDRLRDDKITTLEITPEKSPTLEGVIKRVQNLNLESFDGFVVTDNALAKMKYCSILASIKLQQEFKKPTICTMSMRDKNFIALQSALLGANDFDLRVFLTLTGDPARMSDQANAKGVFEGDSVKLLQIIKSLNVGVDYSGKSLKEIPKKIYPLSVINSYSKNFSTIEKKIEKKIENFSSAIITQPLYDIEVAKKLKESTYEIRKKFGDERGKCEIVFGLFPILKFKTAQFLSSHVPGIYIPQKLIDRLLKASKISEDEERKVGLEINRKIYKEIKDFHPKMHIMVANNFNSASEIIG